MASETCLACDGDGRLCVNCMLSQKFCECAKPNLKNCEECFKTGEVSAGYQSKSARNNRNVMYHGKRK